MKENFITIKELKNEHEWKAAFPVVKQLRTDLNEIEYIKLLNIMNNEGYRMFALFENEEISSVIGITQQTNLYDGKHIFVYDLITDKDKRSKGYGEKLLSYIEDIGRSNNYETITLTSGLQRIDAHRFYENKMGYSKWSYSFKKNLNP